MANEFQSDQPPSPTPSAPIPSGTSLQALRFSKTMPDIGAIAQKPTTPIISPEAPPVVADVFPAVKKGDPGWLLALKAIGVFIGTFALVFVVLESPAFLAKARFALKNTSQNTAASQNLAFLPKLQDRPVSITEIKDKPQDFFTPDAQLAGFSLADLGDNQLLIPKIEINAPIIWGSAADEISMLSSLQQGVAHYGFTALPSDGRGKVFISGHSSYLLWDPGKFKTVFANLDRLTPGDQMAVTYQGIVYIYEVTEKKVVKPADTSVLDQTEESTLSLMTCVPVGTSLNRLVVTSKLVSATSNQPIPVAPPSRSEPASIFHYLVS